MICPTCNGIKNFISDKNFGVRQEWPCPMCGGAGEIKKPRGRNGGRPAQFEGGLKLIHVLIRNDQASWLNRQPNKSEAVRKALDAIINNP